MKKLLFLYNPHSGKSVLKNHLANIVDLYCKNDYMPTIVATQHAGHVREIVTEHALEYDHIVVSGGDGTIRECVTGLMAFPAELRPHFGYIPSGTTNDFAKSLGIPRVFKKAAQQTVEGSEVVVDIGQINQSYFVYVAAFGAFTEVTYMTPQEIKNILGHPAYILEGVKALTSIRPQRARIVYGNTVLEDDFLLVLVSNSYSIGGFKDLAGKNVGLNDGLLELTLIRKPKNPLDYNDIVYALLSKNESEYVLREKVSKLELTSEKPIDWVVDGEFGGSLTEVSLQVIPQAMRILV